MNQEERFSIVLAGGRGTRLAALTTVDGEVIPKQYCALAGGPSMLRQAISRGEAVAGRERLLVVVAADQRRWWEPQLRDLPAENIVVQPADRGTAAGVLLPLAEVLRRCADAVVTVVPADHHVEYEATLRSALARADWAVRRGPRPIALIGVRPQDLDPDLGWIVPCAAAGATSAQAVERFREKPTLAEVVALLTVGAVVNTFLFTARARAMWEICQELIPEVTVPLAAAAASNLPAVYAQLPARDFSRAVLERSAHRLSVVTASRCGWSDLGTPARVARCLRRTGHGASEAGSALAVLDLSRQLASGRLAAAG
jgi:mannose-1-phosphate guanylyltransferase